jgi:hypothetical protein
MKSQTLSPKQDRAAALLASGMNVRNCAAEVDAGERTLLEWLLRDEFKKQVTTYQSRLIDEALGKLADAATWAVATATADEKLSAEPAAMGPPQSPPIHPAS